MVVLMFVNIGGALLFVVYLLPVYTVSSVITWQLLDVHSWYQ